MTTPVLFLIFNRPELAEVTFERIRAARPERLFVHADGPRLGNPDDPARCRAARAIIERVDWPCRVDRLFRDTNLGCGPAVAGALQWFFQQVEEGIVLEDDCVPHPAFFAYATQMLARYRSDARVIHISGTGFIPHAEVPADAPAVYLSPFPFVWGWATWARAWQRYAYELPDNRTIRAVVNGQLSRRVDRRYWLEKLTATRDGRIGTWDYQWVYAHWAARALAITPTVSLVENRGFGSQGTHCVEGPKPKFAPLLPIETAWPGDTLEISVELRRLLTSLNDRLFCTAENAPEPAWAHALQRFPVLHRIYARSAHWTRQHRATTS